VIGVALLSLLVAIGPAHATPEEAARFYEDALARFDRGDTSGAVVQLKNALQQDNRMLAAHLLLGKALLKTGNLKAAEAAFEEALKQGVNRGEVALALGHIYLALGQPEAVIAKIPASGLPPSLQVDVLSMRGTAYNESGNSRLASQSFQEARALDPKSVTPLIAEIPVLLSIGQIDSAKATAAKAIKLAPNNGYAWNMQASVLHATLDVGGALAAYDRALSLEPKHVDARVARAALLIDLKREPEAERDLDLLRTAAPEEPRAAYLRAVIASQKGDGPAIAAALKEAVEVIDSLPSPWLARREQLLMVGALAHHGLGNWEKAREYLNIIISHNSRDLGARKLLASIYVDMRDYSRAESLLEELRKAAPGDPQVLFLLGSVRMAKRRYLEATELLEKAAARTGSGEMNRTLAFSQMGLGRNELGLASLEKAFAANPGDTQAGTALAMVYMRRGQTPKAMQTAEAMVKREPANLTALNFLGTVKGATGDKAGARSAYTQVLARDPAFRPAALNLARLDVSEKRFDDARRRLNEMLAKRHDDPDVLYEFGMVELRAGRAEEAIRHLQKASEVQRRDPRAGLALIEVQHGQRQADQALATAKELALRYPDNIAVLLALGRTQLAVGDKPGARSTFQGATRLAEFDPGTQIVIGHLQLAAANPDGASYNAQKALLGRPDDPAALALVVEIEMRRGDAAKADAALKTMNAKHPNRVETAVATADLAMSRGQYAAAVAAYRTALSRNETTANALNLVRAYLVAGDAGKAATFLEGWVKSRPNDLPAAKALAEAQFRAGQLPAARASYARVIAAAPDDATTLNNYANLLLQLNDPAAQQQAEKALILAPNNPAFADTVGWILVQSGQIDAGLRYLRDARLRAPESGEIRFHLAYALAKTGRTAEAKEELAVALNGPGRLESNDGVKQLKKELGL
jgi:putative PEP-CTERM system TPR-repeat lipoprotein